MNKKIMNPIKIQKYGWKPDLPDHRDLMFAKVESVQLPPLVDLRPSMPAIVDQSDLGSCTANAIAGAFEFTLKKQNLKDFAPSRLFIYYNERVIENSVKTDSGAQIRDGIKTVANQGVCSETTWPYVISKFAKKPTAASYKEALKNESVQYLSIDNTNLVNLKNCLAAGFPFVYGFTVYNSFESDQVAKTGMVPLPTKSEQVLGGHAVVGCGYDDSKQMFICRNSWGTSWGLNGYFYIPYSYLTNSKLAADFWTIRSVS